MPTQSYVVIHYNSLKYLPRHMGKQGHFQVNEKQGPKVKKILKYSTKQFWHINTCRRDRMIPKGWSEMQKRMVTKEVGKHFTNVHTHFLLQIVFNMLTFYNIWLQYWTIITFKFGEGIGS